MVDYGRQTMAGRLWQADYDGRTTTDGLLLKNSLTIDMMDRLGTMKRV